MGQVELIWGAFSLMVLGALISMCMKCQQTGSKQEKANVDNQRTQCENQQDCECPHLRSVSKQSQMKETYHTLNQSRNVSSFNDLETCSKSRFQNFTTEIETEDDSTYIEPISSHHYHNWQPSDDDSHGYQNVIEAIKSNKLHQTGSCKHWLAPPNPPHLSQKSPCGPFWMPVVADEDIYENKIAIQIWKQGQTLESDSGSSEEESIYINTEQYSSSQRSNAHL